MIRPFKRSPPNLLCRKLFIIAAEGKITERHYFDCVKGFDYSKLTIQVHCLKHQNRSAPTQVLKTMSQYLKNCNLKSTDEAWLVVDKDKWTDEQLLQLYKWSQQSDNYGFALSNPSFELWLLLHLEDATGTVTSEECVHQFKIHYPNYNKKIPHGFVTLERVQEAIRRAEARDRPPCVDWPREPSKTTVYRLIKKMIAVQSKNEG